MPTDKERLEKLARRMIWAWRECDGSRTCYDTHLPAHLYGFKHPKEDAMHPADFRAWIDSLPEPNHDPKPKG